MPDWWNHVVDHLQGFGWPSANTDQLRSAADAWRAAGSAVAALTGDLDVATGYLENQRSPKIPTALSVLGSARTEIGQLADQLRAQGQCCDDYATQVDQTRQTIRDLLKDLAIECGVTAGLSFAASFVTFGGAAAVGAGVIAARAVRYARLILAALRGLKAAKAAATLASATPELLKAKEAFDKLRRAQKMVRSFQAAAKGKAATKGALNAKQLKNYNRFAKKFGKDLADADVRSLPNGNMSYTITKPGNTVQMVKTTYDPQGNIVHIKDKF